MTESQRDTSTQMSFPDLRILPVNALLPHEEHDAQRAQPLVDRIRQATVWLNPPIIAPIDNSTDFVVLDGANRHYALKALNYEHILAQVVDYHHQDVLLDTWHHAVRGLPQNSLLSAIQAIPDITIQPDDHLNAQAALAARDVLAYFIVEHNQIFTLRQQNKTINRTTILRRLVNAYKNQGLISRITHDDFNITREMYPDTTGIMVFPHYEPAEIMVAARDGDLLPPGITRHLIHGRALRLNYPLAQLKNNTRSLKDKNEHLTQWMQQRLAAKHIRFYAEPTFLFDE